MHCENFKISSDNIGLNIEGIYHDLHNDYDFIGFTHDEKNKSILFTWEKTNGEWVNKENPNSIQIKFEDVSLFKQIEKNLEIPLSEHKTLSYIGFLHPDQIKVMDGYADNKSIENNYHFVLGLESEASYKIEAKLARCHIEKNV